MLRMMLGALVALVLSIGVVGPTPATAAFRSLSLAPGEAAWVAIAGTRTSSIASAMVTVGSTRPFDVGLQFRASGKGSGYRAVLTVGPGGSVTGGFRRVSAGEETVLGHPGGLALNARPGAKIHLEAAVVGGTVVKLYLRAWLQGARKPPSWQLSAGDATGFRLTTRGRTYLWAHSSAGAPLRLLYAKTSSRSFSVTRALAVGLGDAAKAARAGGGQDTFSIAIIPDTQAETNDPGNTPFLNRTSWLVANKGAFDLRYVLHTGDVTNWGWLDPGQFSRARAAMNVLTGAGLPYAVSIGNHDTAAVGWNGVRGSTRYGGSAYMYNPECRGRLGAAACKSWLLVRRTRAFNKTFPLTGLGDVSAVFSPGSADNYASTFRANGTDWLVLTLELWPRKEVVAWARTVVAGHRGHNVIIQTHSYLDSRGRVATSNGGYGATSPRYLYDQVVSRYSNVKLVFSGHTGRFTSRTDTRNGDPVVSYLGNDLGGPSHNPVRILTINTSTGDLVSTVYDPIRRKTAGTTTRAIRIIS